MSWSSQHKLDRVRKPRVHINYPIEIGGAAELKELPFVIGVLADLGGARDESGAHAGRWRVYETDRDNFDEVMKRLRPRVCFAVPDVLGDDADGELSVELRFESIRDLAPAEIARRTPRLSELLERRKRLRSLVTRITNSDAVEEYLESVVDEHEPEDPGAARLEEIFRASTEALRSEARLDIEALRAVSRETPLERGSLHNALTKKIESIDAALSRQVSRILHHPTFQALERAWRALHYLVHNTNTGYQLRIRVVDVTKAELAEDLAGGFEESALWRMVWVDEYWAVGGHPYGALIGDYQWGPDPRDVSTLETLADLCAEAAVPFLSAASPRLFGIERFAEINGPNDLARTFEGAEHLPWQQLRERSTSKFLVLTLPRFLARGRYGESDMVRAFDFREEIDGDESDYDCWINSAYALGARLAEAFDQQGWCAAIRGVEGGGLVSDLPSIRIGEQRTVGPTEVAITDRREAELNRLGIASLVSLPGTDKAAFFAVRSVHAPKQWDTSEANANEQLTSQLPYLMPMCRFLHYVRAIQRDWVGAYEREDIEKRLNRWISGYVLTSDSAGADMKAKFPLREARIDVTDKPDQPGVYKAVLYLRPHFQLEDIDFSLRMAATLPSPGG